MFSVWKQDSHMYQNFFTGEAEPGSEMTLLDLNPNSLEIKGLCFVGCGLGARIRQPIWMYGMAAAAVETCSVLEYQFSTGGDILGGYRTFRR